MARKVQQQVQPVGINGKIFSIDTQEGRREICQQEVTFNGERALVSGASMRFPIVRTLKGFQQVEYCWETVLLFMNERGGRFEA